MKKMPIFAAILSLCLLALPATAAQQKNSGPGDRSGLSLTIYNGGFAFVRDARKVDLPKGLVHLAFQDIAAAIRPATARLHAPSVRVLEQNFDFDLLSAESLLKKHVGRVVGLARSHPTSGEDKIIKGTLLSVAGRKAVIKAGDRIEVVDTSSPYRLVFYDVPPDLKQRPTLSMLLESAKAGRKDLELSYLSGGLDWRADYVATLSPDEKSLDIKAWVTLVNKSGVAFPKATLQLLAGQVHRVADRMAPRRYKAMRQPAAMPAPAPQREQLFEYHLYTIGRPVSLADKQSKQVELFTASRAPVKKEYLAASSFSSSPRVAGLPGREIKVRVYLHLDNSKPALGLPLPAGVVRLHKRDSRGMLQFIGEDRIDHTPEGREVRLNLGHSFDVTARKKYIDFKRFYGREFEAAAQITLHNARSEAVVVKVAENMSGTWEIVEESLPHKKEAAHLASWMVTVPPKGKTVLEYRVRVQ